MSKWRALTCAGWGLFFAASLLALGGGAPAQAQAPAKKPNILVIFGDDIGIANVSAYTNGLMGYRTPNIDRIARDGMIFTDYYAEQSCTAGRSTFITGQTTLRTGLSKVGLPGSDLGLRKEDITVAEALKPLGYATGQFGKNHLGDKDEFLPTNHGFDEFFGNLYHLNAEEEPENPDYPKDPEFRKKYGPRGVIRSFADGRIQDTGPLTKKRMETINDDLECRRRLHEAPGPGRQAVLRLVQRHADAPLHPHPAGISGPQRNQRVRRRDAGARRARRTPPQDARRPRHLQ